MSFLNLIKKRFSSNNKLNDVDDPRTEDNSFVDDDIRQISHSEMKLSSSKFNLFKNLRKKWKSSFSLSENTRIKSKTEFETRLSKKFFSIHKLYKNNNDDRKKFFQCI